MFGRLSFITVISTVILIIGCNFFAIAAVNSQTITNTPSVRNLLNSINRRIVRISGAGINVKGTGFLVKKDAGVDIYTVLTNDHVVKTEGVYEITTVTSKKPYQTTAKLPSFIKSKMAKAAEKIAELEKQ